MFGQAFVREQYLVGLESQAESFAALRLVWREAGELMHSREAIADRVAMKLHPLGGVGRRAVMCEELAQRLDELGVVLGVVRLKRRDRLGAQLLELRARRPGSFLGGSYEPLQTGEKACAFLRGDDVLVAVAVRDEWAGAEIDAPAGRWRDVLSGEECSFPRRVPLARVLSEHGVAVFERIG